MNVQEMTPEQKQFRIKLLEAKLAKSAKQPSTFAEKRNRGDVIRAELRQSADYKNLSAKDLEMEVWRRTFGTS